LLEDLLAKHPRKLTREERLELADAVAEIMTLVDTGAGLTDEAGNLLAGFVQLLGHLDQQDARRSAQLSRLRPNHG
jgi:hypothetical protein